MAELGIKIKIQPNRVIIAQMLLFLGNARGGFSIPFPISLFGTEPFFSSMGLLEVKAAEAIDRMGELGWENQRAREKGNFRGREQKRN